MLEETLVWSTTQEVLAHGHKGSKIGDGIVGEMVELRPKEIQKPSEEKMWWQREPSIYMSRQEDTLTLLRLRLPLRPRKPRRSVLDQPLVG